MIIYEGPNTRPVNKYHQWYIDIVHNRQVNVITRDDGYCERHHIVPKSLGGSNNSTNLVNLTAREHFIAHVLLTKFLEGQEKYKMLCAIQRFKYNKQQYFNSHIYENVIRLKSSTKRYVNNITGDVTWSSCELGGDWVKQGASTGYKTWYHSDLCEYRRQPSCPGNGWVERSPSSGTTHWINKQTGERCSSVLSPGDGWLNEGFHKNKHHWHNPLTGEYVFVYDAPGDDWINQGQCKGMLPWINNVTGQRTCAVKRPSNEWVMRGHVGGTTMYYNEDDDVYRRFIDNPGEGWIKMGANVGEKSGMYAGKFCHTDFGCFDSAKALADVVGISTSVVGRICRKKNNDVIGRITVTRTNSWYIENMGYDIVGMTWRELGFYFIPKDAK
jgi:hypothetical protein